jgi:hypothetical protein
LSSLFVPDRINKINNAAANGGAPYFAECASQCNAARTHKHVGDEGGYGCFADNCAGARSVLVEIGQRHFEENGESEKAAGTDAVAALLVFLDLLED